MLIKKPGRKRAVPRDSYEQYPLKAPYADVEYRSFDNADMIGDLERRYGERFDGYVLTPHGFVKVASFDNGRSSKRTDLPLIQNNLCHSMHIYQFMTKKQLIEQAVAFAEKVINGTFS